LKKIPAHGFEKVGRDMLRMLTWVGASVIEALLLVTLCGASEYLPGRPNDIKVFEDTRFGNTRTMEVDRKLGNWRHYTTFGGFGPLWIWTSTESECIYVWSDVVDSCQMITDFSKNQGFTSRIDLDPCNRGQSVLAGRDETVLTPAGKFEGSVRVDFQTSCADAGVTSMWFAPDVGVIKWSSLNIAGPVDHVLLSGTINGEAYPRSLGVSGTFSDTSVYLNMMPPIDPLSVQEVQASIEIKNGTTHEISFYFVNGQRFEISITDEQNTVVSRWSRGRSFIEMTETVTVASGDSLRYFGEVALTNDEGDPLPPGHYTVMIEVTSSPDDQTNHKMGSERIRITSPLTIDWVY
jgi:hypothetical protein